MAHDESRLARVRWSRGQVLRPEHLVAQEVSAQRELDFKVRALGLPAWGVRRLEWDANALEADSRLLVRALEVVLPSGELISMGANAILLGEPPTLSSAQGERLAVYLHLLDTGSGGASKGSAEPAGAVERAYKSVQLSTGRPEKPLETMELARFVLREDGGWGLASSFIPPCLSVVDVPFFTPYLAALDATLRAIEHRLTQELAIGLVGGDGLTHIKAVLKSIYEAKALMADMAAGAALHPHGFISALRALYFELYFFQGEPGRYSPALAATPYVHADAAPALAELMVAIQEIGSWEWAKTGLQPFERAGDRFELDPLPAAVLEATEIYLIVQKPRVGFEFDIDRVKLASHSRLTSVHRFSLVGIRLERLELPPMAQNLGPNVEYYRIVEGDEWLHARREGNLTFYILDGFEPLRVSLGWRVP